MRNLNPYTYALSTFNYQSYMIARFCAMSQILSN